MNALGGLEIKDVMYRQENPGKSTHDTQLDKRNSNESQSESWANIDLVM